MIILNTAKINERYLEIIKNEFVDTSIVSGKWDEFSVQELSEAEAIFTFGQDITNEVLEKCTNLKWIMVLRAGLDKLPFKQLEEKNIIVTNVKGIHKAAMSEHTFALILQDSRNLVRLLDNQRQKLWDGYTRVEELEGKNIVIVGVGAIGEEIARKAKAFNMNTIGINRSGVEVPYVDKIYTNEKLLEALKIADYTVVVIPLTPETEDLFGEKEFRAMPESSYFINIARGQVVQEEALLKALNEGWIRGAALDTVREEPLTSYNPLWNAPKLIITPHLGGVSPNYMKRAIKIIEYNLRVYKLGKGEMKNLIDLKKSY